LEKEEGGIEKRKRKEKWASFYTGKTINFLAMR